MAAATYSDLLNDPRWENKRKEILMRDKYTCQSCGAKNCEVHVHHSFYVDGEDPWDYSSHLLITLCADCHKKEEDNKETDSMMVKQFLSLMLLRSDLSDLFWAILHKVSPIDEHPANTLPLISRRRFRKIIEQIQSTDTNGETEKE